MTTNLEPTAAAMLELLTRLHRATRARDALIGMKAPIREVAALTETINDIADELTRVHPAFASTRGSLERKRSA